MSGDVVLDFDWSKSGSHDFVSPGHMTVAMVTYAEKPKQPSIGQ